MVAVLALVVALGANGMGVTLPRGSELVNCSQELPLLDGPYLQHSINVFAGIFFTLTLLSVLYDILWIVNIYLNLECISNNIGVFGRIVSHSCI